MKKKWIVIEELNGKILVENTLTGNRQWTNQDDLAWLNGERKTEVSTPEEIAAMFAAMDADWDATSNVA